METQQNTGYNTGCKISIEGTKVQKYIGYLGEPWYILEQTAFTQTYAVTDMVLCHPTV